MRGCDPAPLDVRLIRPEDRPEWVRLRDELWPGSREDHVAETEAFFREPDPRLATFVLERPDGRLGGFIEMGWRSRAEDCRTAPVAYIEGWYVDPDLRRRGLGARLVRAGEAWARENGYREIASDSYPDNELGIRAHRALGYEEVARAVCFRKELGTGDATSHRSTNTGR